jgi:hypothetical protein
MTHASLFSGIGGFDLAAEWMGWENIFHCEWNPFGQKVLAHHFPNSKSYNDITKTNFTIHEGTIDVLSGGFPCQPYSMVGKRLGKEDERHLWPEMLRTIKEVKPTWVVGENVLGIVNWGGEWFSTMCKLNWKIRGTKYKRIYFQLVPKTLHTEGTEFGLLPTPTTMQIPLTEQRLKKRTEYRKSIGRKYVAGNLMEHLQYKGLIPTPTKSDFQPRWKTENWEGTSDLPSVINEILGTRSQLNPLFVEEMMGFPKNWTLSAFQNIKKNQ